MSTVPVRPTRSVSIWPFLLIAIGVIWLLREADIITRANLSVLSRLWPLVLIAIGVELLLGRERRGLSILIGVGTIVLLIVLMLVGPSFGLAQTANAQTAAYADPLGDASSATVTIGAGAGDLRVRAVGEGDTLMQADIRYVGDVVHRAEVQGDAAVVELTNETNATSFSPFDFFDFLGGETDLRWDIGLKQDVPMALTLSTGAGDADIDLSALTLTQLTANTGAGDMHLSLPMVEGDTYSARITSGAGTLTVDVEDGAALELSVNSGAGDVTIDLPDDAAVRVEGSTGAGELNMPAWLERVGQEGDSFISDRGTWESANFAGSARQIRVVVGTGAGSVHVR